MTWWADPTALRRAAEGVVFLFLLIILGVYGSAVYFRTTETARRRTCANNLRLLGMSLQMYSADFDGMLPPGGPNFVRQVFNYIPHMGVLLCPSDDQVRPTTRQRARHQVNVSYVYQAPTPLDLDAIPDTTRVALAWDRDGGVASSAHGQGGNVLYADGHTRWRPMVLWPAANQPPGYQPPPGAP
ncbi:MAG: DUF1559 domain-containing protein [Armatimonadota bacterium]|nr:DUF1559 domain-containing protein [Armatimonadota bacterium]